MERRSRASFPWGVVTLAALALEVGACGDRSLRSTQTPARGSEVMWPSYVVSPGAMFRGPRSSKSVAFVGEGVRLELEGRFLTTTPDTGRVPVHVGGALELWLTSDLRDLHVLVCRAGELPGTELYAGVGDSVALAAPVRGSEVRIRAKVVLPDRAIERETTLSIAALCTEKPRDPPSPGVDVCPINTVPLAVLSAPHTGHGSLPLTTLPPGREECVVRIGTKNGYARVLVGEGPYLAGWIPAGATGETNFGVIGALATLGPSDVPLELRRNDGLPLYGLAASTDVISDGVRVGKFHRQGFARVLSGEVRDGQTRVMAAVNDEAWVEGWVPAAALLPAATPSKADPTERDRK